MISSVCKRSVASVLIALALSWHAAAQGGQGGTWAERVQVVYDAQTRTVERVRLKVWDSEPHRNLEFLWEPDKGSSFNPAATGGIVEGRGKLLWRVRGSAPQDRRAVYSTYVGEMRNGRPHGQGRLDRREGEIFEGTWVAGLLHGEGSHRNAQGEHYTGSFENGLPHGHGRQTMADGAIYEGSFRNGLRHGEGRMRLAGGTEYLSRWKDGVEQGTRPDIVADANLGGLLRAQGDGGSAGKVELSLTVEPRMTQEALLPYTHAVSDERIEIFPESEPIVLAWIGEATINASTLLDALSQIDFSNAPAFAEVRFKTNDQSRVRLESLELQVDDSQVYRKPFLTIGEHHGCIGYRPNFDFHNVGWGPARDARLNLEFFNLDDPQQASRPFALDIGSFDLGTGVSFDDILAQAGLATRELADARFTCSSMDAIPQCRREILSTGHFGELRDLVSGTVNLSVGVRGRVAYKWADDRGNAFDADEPFEAALQLGFIETEMVVAEYGDGVGFSPEALRYQEVRFRSDAQNYTINLPVRGNKNLASYVALLKLFAEEASIHQFRAVARFADGSERYSKPIVLYYMKPQDKEFYAYEDPPGCYIDPGYFGPSYFEDDN